MNKDENEGKVEVALELSHKTSDTNTFDWQVDGQKDSTCDVSFWSPNSKDPSSHLVSGACEDTSVLAPNYDEDGMLDELSLDVELTSRELYIQNIEEEVEDPTYESMVTRDSLNNN